MAVQTSGNCYLCGAEFKKAGMRTHLLKKHYDETDSQECWLLKIENKEIKNYWLYIDVPVTSTLQDVDYFLRDIWLECCGHLSGFFEGRDDLDMDLKLNGFYSGQKLLHQYDFGSTTYTLITFMSLVKRPSQQKDVRLLARNVPLKIKCRECGEPAEYLCEPCLHEDYEENYFCESCAGTHEHEGYCNEDIDFIEIINSPRMGVCGYDSEVEEYVFNPSNFQ